MDEMSEELQNRLRTGKRMLETLRQYKFSPKTKDEMINSFNFINEKK